MKRRLRIIRYPGSFTQSLALGLTCNFTSGIITVDATATANVVYSSQTTSCNYSYDTSLSVTTYDSEDDLERSSQFLKPHRALFSRCVKKRRDPNTRIRDSPKMICDVARISMAL